MHFFIVFLCIISWNENFVNIPLKSGLGLGVGGGGLAASLNAQQFVPDLAADMSTHEKTTYLILRPSIWYIHTSFHCMSKKPRGWKWYRYRWFTIDPSCANLSAMIVIQCKNCPGGSLGVIWGKEFWGDNGQGGSQGGFMRVVGIWRWSNRIIMTPVA